MEKKIDNFNKTVNDYAKLVDAILFLPPMGDGAKMECAKELYNATEALMKAITKLSIAVKVEIERD